MTTPLTLAQLRAVLQQNSALTVVATLPDGRRIPAQFHVTEAGTVTKDFIDCGGTRRRRVTAQLQTWIGRDEAHRLSAARLARILEVCAPVLPAGDTEVEIEYEDATIAQYPLVGFAVEAGELVLQLGLRHTDCLAREACEAPRLQEAGCGCGTGCR